MRSKNQSTKTGLYNPANNESKLKPARIKQNKRNASIMNNLNFYP